MKIFKITIVILKLSIESQNTLLYIKFKQENLKNLKLMIIITKILKISFNKIQMSIELS